MRDYPEHTYEHYKPENYRPADEDYRHGRLYKAGHNYRGNEKNGRTDEHSYTHLISVLNVGNVRRNARDKACGGIFIDVRKRVSLDIVVHILP